MLGFDPVTVSPIPGRILHIIIKDEQIHRIDDIKIPFPGKIIGLIDRDLHHNFSLNRSISRSVPCAALRTDSSGRFFNTTAPVPTTTSLPMEIRSRMVALVPKKQCGPVSTYPENATRGAI